MNNRFIRFILLYHLFWINTQLLSCIICWIRHVWHKQTSLLSKNNITLLHMYDFSSEFTKINQLSLLNDMNVYGINKIKELFFILYYRSIISKITKIIYYQVSIIGFHSAIITLNITQWFVNRNMCLDFLINNSTFKISLLF